MDDAARTEVAARYIAATRAGDSDALAALSEPDVEFWHNFDDAVVGIDATTRTLRWLHRTVPDLAWDDVALHVTDDGFVWRSVITGSAPGGPLRAHTCVVATLSPTGKVTRLDEYLDPAAMANLSVEASGTG